MFSSYWARIIKSPVYTSWLSLIVQAANTIFILPLAIVNFSQDELTVWLALAVIVRFRDIFDFGLLVTISRHVAEGASNQQRLAVRSYARQVFYKVNLLAIICLPFVFFISLFNVIKDMDNTSIYIICSILSYFGCIVFLKGNFYRAYIIGVNKIQLIKINEVWVNTILAIATIIYIVSGFGILPIILSQTVSFFVLYLINRKIYLRITPRGSEEKLKNVKYTRDKELASCAKREFFSGLVGSAFVQVVNITILNLFSQSIANNYLIIERVVEQIKNFSRVVFYVKLPYFSKLFIRNEIDKLNQIAVSRYSLSLLLLVLSIWGGSLVYWLITNVFNYSFGDFYLDYQLALLFVFYAIIERMTSMHNQIYLITNDHVVSHIGMSVTALLFTIFVSLLYSFLGIYSIPISFAISYFSFFYWFVSKNSFFKLNTKIYRFEIIPICLFAINTIIFTLVTYEAHISHS